MIFQVNRLFPTKILLQEITLQQNLFHMVIIRKVEKQSLPDAISLLLILLLKLFSLQMAVICIQTARLQILLILPVTVYILLMYISLMKWLQVTVELRQQLIKHTLHLLTTTANILLKDFISVQSSFLTKKVS